MDVDSKRKSGDDSDSMMDSDEDLVTEGTTSPAVLLAQSDPAMMSLLNEKTLNF